MPEKRGPTITARWALALSVATAIMVASSGGEAPPSVSVPAGLPVALDGVLGDDEWGDALAIPISDAVTLHLKCVDGALCLGVRAPEMGVGNLLIADGDNVRILHSSAALGTAVYEPAGDAWRLKADFVWRCRSLGASEAANAERKRFLETDGWLASTAYMGNPGDLEYQIAVDAQPMRIAFLWLPVSDPRSALSWPAGVSQDLIPGPIPSASHFDVSEWATVTMQTASQTATRATSEAPAGIIAFSSSRGGNTDIYTIRSGGSDPVRLTDHPAEDLLPAWSPSGEWIAFVSARDGNREIYLMRPDGSCVVRLTDHPGEDMYPVWKPE